MLRSVIVFIDAVLLSFDAPKQFPDSSVLVQLDADLAFEAVEVEPDEDDEEGVESNKFSTVEELVCEGHTAIIAGAGDTRSTCVHPGAIAWRA